MKHEPFSAPTTTQTPDRHRLNRDYETRSRLNLKKVGLARYAADPSTTIICMAYAVDDGPVQRWFPGDPVPPVWFEAAANPDEWVAIAHNDPFDSAIEQHVGPRYGFPPILHHRCTQAASLAAGLPAKLDLLANVMEFTHRKDAAGERLMHQMSKPRKARKGEDPNGVYWHDDPDKISRLSDYNVQDVEVEREANDYHLPRLSDAEQAIWMLSNKVNARGFHVDRAFAEAARKIAGAAGPEIDAELKELTAGTVETINQIDRLKGWLHTQGCTTTSLDRETIEGLLENEDLAPSVRQVLQLRLDGAQAAVRKIDALLAQAGADDRIRGAFRYHGASTGRWSGAGFQPQNIKRSETEDLDAAIAAVMTGDYAHLKRLYPKPLSVIGDCIRSTVTAADDHDLIGADLSSIESRVAAWVAGEEWKLDSYRRFDASHDPRDEPYCTIACRIYGVPDGTFTKKSPERAVGKTCDLAFGYMGGLGAWRKFEPDKYSDAEVEVFKNDFRATHPEIVRFWHAIDSAAVRAVYEIDVEIVCGPVILKSDGKFLRIRLPSGRDLSYPNPRLIVDDHNKAVVVYDDNSGGKFVPCRGGFGAYGGVWFENIVSGIARDILVEAMFRVEAAGYPITMHVHDELVCEVPEGFGSEQEFLALLTQRPSWALDLPIAANAWRGPRFDKADKPIAGAAPPASQKRAEAGQETITVEDTPQSVPPEDALTPDPQLTQANDSASIAVSFTRFKSRSRLSKLYERGVDDKVIKTGGTEMSRGEYEIVTIRAADPREVLTEIGTKIDVMGSREAIALGVVRDTLPLAGDITTKAAYERRQGNKRAMATGIPRALSHFNWPSSGHGLLYFDGDERDDLREILIALYPDFAEVAALVRPSASASVKDPMTGLRLKAGEHLFVLLDDPSKARDCLLAVRRLAWCLGSGRPAGWIALAKDGDPLVYGPVDVSVGSPERLVYEGEVSLGKGLERLPRNSTVIGGNGVLCAANLIAFADLHAPVKQFNELVQAAKNDPAFLAQQAAVKAAYRADYIEKAVARGGVREEIEREFDRLSRAAGTSIGGRIWRELSPHHVLYRPDGTSFTAAEMAAMPAAFHKRECADPVEGMDYQTRNCGFILHQGGRVEIYSRAHGDRYAYFLPLSIGGSPSGPIASPGGSGGGGSGAGGAGGSGGGAGGGGPQPGFAGKTKPVIKYGPLSVMADDAAKALIEAGVPFYQRGKWLVRPVVVPVQSFHGQTTNSAQLVEVELPYLRDKLCQNSSWVKYDGRSRSWVDIHPPADAAQVLLKRFGDWKFRVLAGIISTPTLRPDGTILKDAGYDPATQLLLIDPPDMPDIPDKPTREDALAALKLLKDLLSEFPFAEDKGVSLAGALSAIISTVCRGAFPIVPIYIADAPEAGSGKSYLLSTVSWIATGQAMPVLGSSNQEELNKQLNSAVLTGQSQVCIDNIVGEIGGETICRLTEQPRPQVRLFGLLKTVNVDARSISFYANGNNIIVVGDLCRRVIRSRLDTETERPGDRKFKNNPREMVLADRGKYIAACLTICRAYIVEGRPNKLPPLHSYGEWSDTVRSALVWLGEADCVKSQEMSRADDPQTAARLTMLNEWKDKNGTGMSHGRQASEIITLCEANKATPTGKDYLNKGLRDAVLAIMPPQHSLKPDAQSLGTWLRSQKDRRVGKLRFCNKPATGHTPTIWWVEEG